MYQDTTPEQVRRHCEGLRALGIVGRARALQSLDRGVRRLAEAGLRRRYPGVTPEGLRVLLAARRYGPELAQRLLGPLP